MKVAVITPYHRETGDQIRRCITSVISSAANLPGTSHIMVGDGPADETNAEVETWCGSSRMQRVVLPVAHADYGDTPRLIGTIMAFSQGFDAVCWLDGDCWFEDEHLESMIELANREVVSVVTATRTLRRPDGSVLGTCTESDGETFCDTNCYLVTRDAIPMLAPRWGLKPKAESVVGDRRVWEVARTLRRTHLNTPTVNYETTIAAHYLQRGETPPENAKVIAKLQGESYYRSYSYSDFNSRD
jgi:hypothetical protein